MSKDTEQLKKLLDEKSRLERELLTQEKRHTSSFDVALINNKYLWLLVAIMAVMTYSLVGMVVFVEIPEANEDIAKLGVGTVFTAFNIAVGYIFGRRERLKSED